MIAWHGLLLRFPLERWLRGRPNSAVASVVRHGEHNTAEFQFRVISQGGKNAFLFFLREDARRFSSCFLQSKVMGLDRVPEIHPREQPAQELQLPVHGGSSAGC